MAEFDPDAFLAKREKRGGFDPDAFLAKTAPETAAQTFGRSATSLADTALNAVTGTLDVAAYPFARAYYGMTGNRTPEQAAAMAQQQTTSPKDVVGRAFGVAGTQGYENAPLRAAGRYIGEGLQENVIQPIANTNLPVVGNIPEADVGNMLNSLAMGVAPVAGKAAAPVARTVKNVAQAPIDVLKGGVGRATGYIAEPGATPKGYQVPSSRVPLGETYIPAEAMAELKQGMPISEGAIRPISELAPGPVLALSGGEVPIAGQAARAFGERLGETYSNPYTAAADIGSMFLTGGVPVLTAGRGALGLAKAGADAYLARKGFTSLTPEQTAALNRGINPFYEPPTVGPVAPSVPTGNVFNQPQLPQLSYSPAGETAIPMSGPGRRINIEGETFNLPYEINTSQVQTARPQPQPTVLPVRPTAEAPVQPTINTQPIKPLTVAEDVGKTAEQLAAEQKILDFINARRGIVTNDPVATRQNFANTIEQTRQQLEQARIQNKELFGDRATAMNERAGQGSLMPNPKDTITDATAVRHMINQTTQSAVKQQGKKVAYSQNAYNDLAQQAGITLDWKTAPDISNMGVGEARKAMSKWMFDSIDAQSPELGLKTRKESFSVQQRRAESEFGIGKETLTPEELAANEKRKQAINAALGKSQTSGTAGQTTGINSKLQALLDKQKAAGNYRPPKDTMETMTGSGVHATITDAANDAMVQTVRNPDYFNVSYRQGNNIVHETKQPNYHAVEIEFPDGTTQKMTEQIFGGEKHYSQVANADFGQAKSLPSSNTKPADWTTVLDEFTKQSDTPHNVNEMGIARVGDILFDPDAPVTRPVRPDITEAKIVDTPAFKQVYDSQADFAFDNTFAEITNAPLQGKYLNADKTKVIEVRPNPHYNPDLINSQRQLREFAYDAKTGKQVPMGEKWTWDEPAPYSVLKETQNSGKPYDMIGDAGPDYGVFYARGNFAKSKTMSWDKNLKITDILEKTGRGESGENVKHTIYQGINKQNNNIFSIEIYSDEFNRNGGAFDYSEYASGKFPSSAKKLFTNLPARQQPGKQVIGQSRYLKYKDGKPEITVHEDYLNAE
jgi:hypothetical protein